MNKNNIPAIIMWGLTGLVIVLGILAFLAPPSVFPDPANGFQVMRSMELGGGFNQIISPDPDDLAKNTPEFLTWWSPGQYLVPYAFKLILGVNTGQASALTITLCQLLGLWGFYLFFKKIGFSPLIASLSMLFIGCQQFFVVPYVFYPGGEVLLFGFMGWFFFGLVAVSNTGRRMTIIVLLSGIVGFLCKSSFVWIYAAGLLFLWIRLSTRTTLSYWVWNALWIGIPGVSSLVTIWYFFLSRGQNPATVAAGIKLSSKAFFFPLASPLLAGFSIDDLSRGLIFHTGKPAFSDVAALIIIILLAVLSIWLIYRVLKIVPEPDYRLFIGVFYLVAFIFFTVAYLRQTTISYEARHFRIIGLMIVPGLIYLLSKTKVIFRVAFAVIWTGLAVTSILYLNKGYIYNKDKSARGISGIAQQGIDQKSLNQIIALDNQNTDAIFVFVNESLPLEIRHNRVIALQPIGDDLKINYEDYEQSGRAGPLYIVLPESYSGPKEKMILKSFPDYNGWYSYMLSDNFVMYAAK